MIMQKERDTAAALRLLTRLLQTQPVTPDFITTDGLRSYAAALKEVGLLSHPRPGRLQDNNRAENSHLPIRRRARKQQGLDPEISSTLSRQSRRRLQYFQQSTASLEALAHAPDASACLGSMGGCNACCLSGG